MNNLPDRQPISLRTLTLGRNLNHSPHSAELSLDAGAIPRTRNRLSNECGLEPASWQHRLLPPAFVSFATLFRNFESLVVQTLVFVGHVAPIEPGNASLLKRSARGFGIVVAAFVTTVRGF